MDNKLKYLIIHCTATKEGEVVTPLDVLHWHTDPIKIVKGKNVGGRGWSKVGYSMLIQGPSDRYTDGVIHYYIKHNKNQTIEDFEITNGAIGTNRNAIHICYVGGYDKDMKPKDTRTPLQLATMENLVKELISEHPQIVVAGHNQFANKDCPCFDVPNWCRKIGIKAENIYDGIRR